MNESQRPVPSKQMRPSPPPQPVVELTDERWVDLREAEKFTGILASTIRNWARKGRIDSRFEMDESGDRRYVELSEVIRWAKHLGRQVASRESRVASEEVASSESRVASRESRVASAATIDGGVEEAGDQELATNDQQPATSDPRPETRDPLPGTRYLPTQEPRNQPETPPIPEGTMLVPLDAWNKMLNQLGNLHDAGQQLAEARERAAKAETEVKFLRERLSEMRETNSLRETDSVTPEPPSAESGPEPNLRPAEAPIDPLWVDLYRRWKRRRG